MPSYQYGKSHFGDKIILRPSYLHNGISYTGKTASWFILNQSPWHFVSLTLVMLNLFLKTQNYFVRFLSFSNTETEQEEKIILHNQYHVCWWPGEARCQGIRSHGIDLVSWKVSSFSIRRVKCLPNKLARAGPKPWLTLTASVGFWALIQYKDIILPG